MEGELTIITGPAGVGKSTYAQSLAASRGACLLDSDTVTEQVVKAGMLAAGLDPNDRDSPEYRQHFREAVYEALFQTASENLVHTDVVLVGPFTSEIQNPDWVAVLNERFDCEIEVLFVTCSEKTRYERIMKRGNVRDAWKLNHWDDYLASSSVEPPKCPHQVISTE